MRNIFPYSLIGTSKSKQHIRQLPKDNPQGPEKRPFHGLSNLEDVQAQPYAGRCKATNRIETQIIR